jgi:4-amino-4-deoxy-L-arabinose transferase-like glycosyltransferase
MILRLFPPLASKDALLVLSLVAGVLFAGHAGRGLVTMDDLREAEVAREIAEGGNYVVPHLAGLPFVEKPPGFPILVALAYRAVGHPSVAAARAVSAAFAALAVAAVFLLGVRTLGRTAALLGVGMFALSPLFCRSSHEILLDNALTATVAWALLFLREGRSSEDARRKRVAYAAAGFLLGLSFLVKGFVGPALLGSGVLLQAVLDPKKGELRQLAHPWTILAFLLPVSLWLIPFLISAPPELLRAFFIDNHLGRFTQAFAGRARPLYFYLQTLGYKLAWAALFLPFAATDAWRHRKDPRYAPALFFLSFSIGPLVLLSLSRAKEGIYLLPAYPAFALLAAAWIERRNQALTRSAVAVAWIAVPGCAVAALLALAWTGVLGGMSAPLLLGSAAALTLLVLLARAWVQPDFRRLELCGLGLWGVACLLWVVGPIAAWEDARQEWRPAAARVIQEAGDRKLLLLFPTDELRGALGFYRRRPALEINDPSDFIDRLGRSPDDLGVITYDDPAGSSAIVDEARRRNIVLEEWLTIPYRGKTLALVGVARDVSSR